jgi:hypothetical protein
VQDAVTEWLKAGDKLDTLKAVLENTFSKVRAERIAVTEVTGYTHKETKWHGANPAWLTSSNS